MIFFFDSSALAKRYVREPGTDSVLDLIRGAESLLASRLTWLEVTSAVSRATRERSLTKSEEILRSLDEDFATLIEILEVTPAVISDARRIAIRHALRAGDAVQLATAHTARLWHGDSVRFVCSDRKLLDTARAEGLEATDPVVE